MTRQLINARGRTSTSDLCACDDAIGQLVAVLSGDGITVNRRQRESVALVVLSIIRASRKAKNRKNMSIGACVA
jgi:hypothetical protein